MPRPRRHRGHAADLWRAVHLAAQRLLRLQRRAVPRTRPRPGTDRAPEDGPVNWTAHADLAEAAAAILADEGRYDGPTPPLTAPEALTFADLAPLAAGVTGRPFIRTTVPDDAFRRHLTEAGVPADRVEGLMGVFTAARTGEFSAQDTALTTLIGRAPVRMEAVLRDQLGSG